jgi:hypothetical protein
MINVTCAIIIFGNKILAAQRSENEITIKMEFQAEKWRRMKIMKNALLGN